MMRTTLLSIALVLTACGPSDGPADGDAVTTPTATTPPTSPGETLIAMSSNGTFEARVTPRVESIPLNEAFAVTLVLIDPATGEAFSDYDQVTIDARMPAHGHGMLRYPELVPEADGAMRAEGFLFHMVGHWEIHVDVHRGPRIERAQMSVNLEF